MARFSRSLGAIFAIGVAGGAAALMLLPAASDSYRPLVAAPPLTNLPCKKQTWPMSDRQCQPWTASRRDRPAEAVPQIAAAMSNTPLRVSIAPPISEAVSEPPETNPAAETPPRAAPPRRADLGRRGPRPEKHAPIAFSARGADGSRRNITIRPTSQQDLYYYASRRDAGAFAR